MQPNTPPAISYDNGKERIRLVTATKDNLVQLVADLNNSTKTYVAINKLIGVVIISGGTANRVFVTFQSDGQGYGKLTDPTWINDDEIYIAIEDNLDPEPVRLTVTREKACEVGAYFLEHGTIPSGLTWEGDMSRFS